MQYHGRYYLAPAFSRIKSAEQSVKLPIWTPKKLLINESTQSLSIIKRFHWWLTGETTMPKTIGIETGGHVLWEKKNNFYIFLDGKIFLKERKFGDSIGMDNWCFNYLLVRWCQTRLILSTRPQRSSKQFQPYANWDCWMMVRSNNPDASASKATLGGGSPLNPP